MKKDLHDEDEIKVNKRSTDRLFFESTLLQRVSDSMDFMKSETREFLDEFEPEGFEEFDLDEFTEYTFNQTDDFLDDLLRVKSKIVNPDDFPKVIRDASKNAKIALNRDSDYIRRAKRKLNRLNSDDGFVDLYKTNIRVIELCDMAIDLNESNWEAYYTKGLALVNLEKYDEAIEEFITSLSFDQDNIYPWLEIANANRLNKDYADAIDVYNRVLEKDENSYDAFKGIALSYFSCKNYQKADEFFKKATSIQRLDFDTLELWKECQKKLE
ncbi:tetratricopeptide repeat protein [Methanobrevibacter sp.]|uniref:tetratricopeptide repeat protein n=1 Tax=Methanobrevibacter sp. TaxID=66852 RepID=UPI00388CEEA1